LADQAGWPKVYERAQRGAPDALKAVGDAGEAAKNPVCKAILAFIAGGKKGMEIRGQFESSPYGWSRDAVDGGLQVLLVSGLVRAQDERGKPMDPKELERRNIGKVFFKVESATVTTAQRIQIRKLLQQAGLQGVKQGEELVHVPPFLLKMQELAAQAGGDPPQPAPPDSGFLGEIRLTAGNEQLLALYNRRDELAQCLDTWSDLGQQIARRLPNWAFLQRLLNHAPELEEAAVIQAQVNTIEQQRQLLADPDPVNPLIAGLTQLLRAELNRLDAEYETRHHQGMERLAADGNWQQLEPEQRNQLLGEQKLTLADRPAVAVQSTADVLATLDKCALSMFSDRVAAMPSRFANVAAAAAELCEPEVQFLSVPRRTLKTEADIEVWLVEVKEKLKKALPQGPIVIN
jgi:hypothetical protein